MRNRGFARQRKIICASILPSWHSRSRKPRRAAERNNPLVDAFSMRGYVPSPGVTGHDHFFDAFAKFGGTDHRHLGEWIDEVATRAAAQNEQYLELMHTPDFSHTAAIAREIGWRDELSKLR